MARIRSVHPGLFTDEAFCSVSPHARLLFIGLWTEADDAGAFEWKPIGLKLRLLGADNVDLPALLAELEGANMVKRYTVAGRDYGAVRNFCRFQRPKKPKIVHVMPDEFRTYVGSSEPNTERDDDEDRPSGEQKPSQPPPVPKEAELAPQMEDGGWRMEDGGGSSEAVVAEPASPPAATYAFEGRAIRLSQADFDRWRAIFPRYPDLRGELQVLDDKLTSGDLRPTGKGWFGSVSSWLKAKHDKLPELPADPSAAYVSADEKRTKAYSAGLMNGWDRNDWGPAPGEPGCYVSAEIQRKYGYEPKARAVR